MMSNQNAVVWAKVLLLTVLLYALLAFPGVAAAIGLSWTRSLFLDVVDVPDAPRHGGLLALSWWKVTITAVVTATYAVAVVAWVRRRYRAYPELLASLVVLFVASTLIVLLHWPDLAFAMRDRDAVWPNPISRALVQFALGFPGGMAGQIAAAITAQVLLTVGTLTLLGTNTSLTERPAPAK